MVKNSLRELHTKNDLHRALFDRYLLIIGVLSMVFMCINLFNERPLVNIITPMIVAAFSILCFILSRIAGQYTIARLGFMSVITFLYIPFGYWTSPGSYSAVIYLEILVIFMLTFIATNKWEYLFAVAGILEVLILLQTEIWYPHHYYVYHDAAYRVVDLSINFIAVSLAILATIHYVMLRYRKHSDILFDLSVTDSLTGLYNRRYFNEIVKEEFGKIKKEDIHFSMILLDLNNFKKVNDVYGHMEGDKVLTDIALLLRENISVTATAARYGGDEFVVILPNTLKETATIQFHALSKLFEEYGRQYEEVGFSVAFGIEDSRGKEIEDLYRMTDELLYKKKMEQKGA